MSGLAFAWEERGAAIFYQEKNGKIDRILSYEEEDATYLLVAISICRVLLNHKTSQEALTEMAETVETLA